LDRDGLQDLNIQADWQRKGGTYWVRYVHVELQGFINTSKISHRHWQKSIYSLNKIQENVRSSSIVLEMFE
jgi:hypothetical protein